MGLLMAAAGGGCASDVPQNVTRTPLDQMLFGPTGMRIQPVFTQVSDWTGDGRPDGIEVVLEVQDQFGDPTKASGRIIFELYTYRAYNPDPRGTRVVAPWEGRLDSIEDQRARWNRVNRAYIFQLAYDNIRPGDSYVLTAMFELTGGGRFFDRLIIEGEKASPKPAQPPVIAPPAPVRTPEPAVITPPPAPPPAQSSTIPSATTTTTEPAAAHTPPPRADQP